MRIPGSHWLAINKSTSLHVVADPWLSCKEVPRQQEFRALWLERLVRTLPYWYVQLKSRYSAFYLAIELYEPTPEMFCHSRLMSVVGERWLFFQNHFGVAQDIPLPLEYLAVPGIELLDWQAYPQRFRYTPEEFEQAGIELVNKPYILGEHWGEPCFFVQVGWVWVGQARS